MISVLEAAGNKSQILIYLFVCLPSRDLSLMKNGCYICVITIVTILRGDGFEEIPHNHYLPCIYNLLIFMMAKDSYCSYSVINQLLLIFR